MFTSHLNLEQEMAVNFIPRLRRSAQEIDQVGLAIQTAQTLEHKERQRVSSLKEARGRLADKLRIGVGTIENLLSGRIKKIDATLRDRLQALLIRELEAEIARLQHELEIARLGGERPDSIDVFEVETHLAKARAALEGRG